MREVIPLSERKVDWIFLGFFLINFTFITYIVDVEQLIIADPYDFEYPLWPPPPLVDLVHWWGNNFDPLLMARPAWWRATIWIDSLLFGPFYAAALYAFVKGKAWIRIPCLVGRPDVRQRQHHLHGGAGRQLPDAQPPRRAARQPAVVELPDVADVADGQGAPLHARADQGGRTMNATQLANGYSVQQLMQQQQALLHQQQQFVFA